MTGRVEVELQLWTSSGEVEDRQLSVQPSELATLVQSMVNHWNGVLCATSAEAQLYVNSFDGLFTVTYQTLTDEFFTLLGDPEGVGTREYVSGGQVVDQPMAQLASLDRAMRAAAYFALHGTKDPGLAWGQA